MIVIKLDLDNDICVNDANEVTLKKSNKEGNTLEFRANGLYVDGSKGADGKPGGSGYPMQNNQLVRIGYKGIYGADEVPQRTVMTNIVHRTYTSNNANGTDLQNFRNEVDWVLPGDIFMYEGNPYLVTSVSSTGIDGSSWGAGNVVVSYVPLIH